MKLRPRFLVPILDGNVIRVLTRLFLVEEDTSTTAVRKRLWSLAGEIIPVRKARDFNQALMELGALVCVPENPDCDRCPLNRVCRAHRAGRVNRVPILRTRKPVSSITQYAAILCRGDSVCLHRRSDGELMAGLWTFPRFQSEQALRRQFLGMPTKHLGEVKHAVMEQRITLKAIMINADNGQTSPSTARWISRHKLHSLALPSADRRLAAMLATAFVGSVSVSATA